MAFFKIQFARHDALLSATGEALLSFNQLRDYDNGARMQTVQIEIRVVLS